ncbi:MAG TPA: antibiotic biosynthesis monooxygenase [Polyangiaceae bacterium]
MFRSTLRADLDAAALGELEAVGTRMATLAATMPGFVSYKDFAAPDGENVTVVEFETMEAQLQWRAHPEHAAAQRAARERYFAEYKISVCSVLRVATHSV